MVLATQILKHIKGHYSTPCKDWYFYKKSRATEVLFFLDINILWNYKHFIRELGVAWNWSNYLSVRLVFCQHDFPKAVALCNISLTVIYKMCGHSFDSHCLEKMAGILLTGFSIFWSGWQACPGKLSMGTECAVWCDPGKRLGGSHIRAVVSVSTPVLSFMAYWKTPLGRQILSLEK